MSTAKNQSVKRVTTHTLLEMKVSGEKISMLTAYDFSLAKLVDKAGVDIIRVGIGGGSACRTRTEVGVGIPQLSAIMECSKVAKKYNIKNISCIYINEKKTFYNKLYIEGSKDYRSCILNKGKVKKNAFEIVSYSSELAKKLDQSAVSLNTKKLTLN